MDNVGIFRGYRPVKFKPVRKNGRCEICGIQTHEIKYKFTIIERMKPISINGKVEGGRCLCYQNLGDVSMKKSKLKISETETESTAGQEEKHDLEEESKDIRNSQSSQEEEGKLEVGEEFQEISRSKTEVKKTRKEDMNVNKQDNVKTGEKVEDDSDLMHFLLDFDTQLIVEIMRDQRQNVKLQIEACKVLKHKIGTDIHKFISSLAIISVIAAIEEHFSNPDVIIHAFSLMKVGCDNSDTLKDSFIGNDGLRYMLKVFVAFQSNEDIIQEAAMLLTTICNNDLRSDFAASYGFLSNLIKISKDEKYSEDTITAVNQALSIISIHSKVASQEIELMK